MENSAPDANIQIFLRVLWLPITDFSIFFFSTAINVLFLKDLGRLNFSVRFSYVYLSAKMDTLVY